MNSNKHTKSHLLSLILGLISIPLFPFLIPSIIGLIYGFKGIKQSKQQNGYGKKQSIIGISLSSLSALLFVAMLLTPTKQHNDTSSQTNSSSAPPEIVKQNESSNAALEEERLSISKMKEEAERIKLETERIKVESEKKKAESDRIAAELEQKKIEEEEKEKQQLLEVKVEQEERQKALARMTPNEKAMHIFNEVKEGYAKLIEVALKKTMHDPDSFEFVSFTGQPIKVKGGRIDVKAIYKLRGKNAFGAKVLHSMECKFNTETQELYDIKEPKIGE